MVCRATKASCTPPQDKWALNSVNSSWEYQELCDAKVMNDQDFSHIEYKKQSGIDLYETVNSSPPVITAQDLKDTYLLRLNDHD